MYRVHYRQDLIRVITFVSLMAACYSSYADSLPDRDLSPLTGLYGIPDSSEGGRLVSYGQLSTDIDIATASHAVNESVAGEDLLLDGETTRIDLTWRYGLSDNWEVGINLPYIWHESGSLDNLIEGWHDFFGLPNGGRGNLPQDDLAFLYAGSGGAVDLQQNSNGIGDARLFVARRLSSAVGHSLAIRAGIKFATGDSLSLLGSGSTDAYLSLAGDYSGLFGNDRLNGFFRATAMMIGEPDHLGALARPTVWHGAAGLGFMMTPDTELVLQAATRSAFYNSDIDSLGELAGTLTFGIRFRTTETLQIDIAVTEDIVVGSAPDVIFRIGLSIAPKKK